MRRGRRISLAGLLAAATALFAGPAAAIDGEYVTYGGFEPTVAAFRYIALFFSHGDYGHLVFIIAAVGFAAGAILSYLKATRDPAVFVRWGLTFLVGAGLYLSFITPRGNLFIYDPVKNATETVAGVPDGIVLVASLANMFEQVAVDIADTASPRLYQDTANGTLFDIIRKSTEGDKPISDQFLWESTKSYFLDCVRLNSRLPATGLSIEELKHTSTDLVATFAKGVSPSNFTVVYSAAAPNGTPETCTDAWAAIQPDLVDQTTYTDFIDGLCRSAGFDASDALQKVRCETLIDQVPAEAFNQVGDRFSYVRAAALSWAMQEAMADANPERAVAAETNRRFITQAGGLFVTAQELGPFIRAGFLAAAVSTLPLLAMFLMTPFIGTILRLFIGFFAFVAIWSVIDVGIAQVAHGIAVDAFEEVSRHNIAYTAMMLTPPASVKALAVFGASRLIAIAFASLFVVTVFRLSGASFAALTTPLSDRAEGAGSTSAADTLNPMNRASNTQGLASAGGTSAAMAAGGPSAFAGWTEHHAGRVARSVGEVEGRVSAFGGAPNQAIERAAGVAAGGADAGHVAGVARAAGMSRSSSVSGAAQEERALAATASGRSEVDTMAGVYAADNLAAVASDVAKSTGLHPDEALHRMSGFGHAQTAGRVMGAQANLKRVAGASAVEEERHIGRAEGFAQEAGDMGLPPGTLATSAGRLDARYQSGDVGFDRASADDPYLREQLGAAGEIRRHRQAGEAEGTAAAAAALGRGAGEASYSAAAFDAERRVMANETVRSLLNDLGLPESAFMSAQAGMFRIAATDETVDAMSPYLTPDQREIAAGGGVIEAAFDPMTNKITNTRVFKEQAGVEDTSLRFSDGVSMHSAPVMDGETLFNLAHSGQQGAAQIARMYEQFDARGQEQILEDVFAQNGAAFLSRIAGVGKSVTETGATDVRGEAFGELSGGTPAPLKLAGISARAGIRGAVGTSDSSQVSRSDSVSDYNVQIRNAFDETLGQENGLAIDRASAFANRLTEMHDQAEALGATIAGKAEDPDGFFGTAADAFGGGKQSDAGGRTADEMIENWRTDPPNFGGR